MECTIPVQGHNGTTASNSFHVTCCLVRKMNSDAEIWVVTELQEKYVLRLYSSDKVKFALHLLPPPVVSKYSCSHFLHLIKNTYLYKIQNIYIKNHMLRSADSVVEQLSPPTRSDGRYLPSQAVQRSAFLRCCVRYQRVRFLNQIVLCSVLIDRSSLWTDCRFILISCFV